MNLLQKTLWIIYTHLRAHSNKEYLKLLHLKFRNVLKFRDELKFRKNLYQFKMVNIYTNIRTLSYVFLDNFTRVQINFC